jgi:hypothetical protein
MDIIHIPVKFIANTLNLYQENNGIFLNHNSTKEYSVYTCIPLAILFGLSRFSLQKLSRFLSILKSRYNTRYNYNLDKLYKFNESFIKLFYYYITFSAICQIIKYEENIFPDMTNVFKDVIVGQVRSLRVSAYYIFELSWYLSELFFLDKSKKDFVVMSIHHIFTLTLLGLSYISGFHRIGILVLYCHNINDIFLEAAKCLKYLGFTFSSNVTFVFLIISWIYSRLYLFPNYVIKSAIYDSYSLVLENPSLLSVYYICNTFLIGLLFMHMYWFGLIYKIAVNALRNGETKDEREE